MTKKIESDLDYIMDFTRQRDIFDPEKHENAQVVMAGCGGIGSATALALTKLGIPHINLVDFDDVEMHNIPNQMFETDAARGGGESKVEALRTMLYRFNDHVEVGAINKKIQDIPKQLLRGVVITGFDSMAARSDTWDIVKNNPNVELLIDGRLGKEDIAIYCVNPCNSDHQKYYEDVALGYDDDEAEELACTERAIIDVMFVVAALITRCVRRHYTNDEVEKVIIYNQNTLTIQTG